MKNLQDVNRILRNKNKKNYLLLAVCCFFSVLLITAYVLMMRSPTVLAILPEGGDSRKQVMLIFALAIVGCAVFTAYAASIFFKYKSRETGILMALGATKKKLSRGLFQELLVIVAVCCLSGAILAVPLSWGIWRLFRLFIVNTQEMILFFDWQALLYAAAFTFFVLMLFFFMGWNFIKRTNIIDIVNAQRKSEPIHDVKPWYGTGGIFLTIVGFLMGYFIPLICIHVLKWYPPAIINILYLPMLIGLYMILLYTVIHGFSHRKKYYKHIISRSMMKFQGRQTVRNMFVITLLLAGAYFASFYSPMLASGRMTEINQRPNDFMFHYRNDQDMLTEDDIQTLAGEYEVTITKYKQAETVNLGCDGNAMVEDKGGKYHFEYQKLLSENNFISASSLYQLTGVHAPVEEGRYLAVTSEEAGENYKLSTNFTLLTNPSSNKTLPTSFQGYINENMLATDYYVISDEDYEKITPGLTDEWMETLVLFNVADVQKSFDFAQELYERIVAHSDESAAKSIYYDRIGKRIAEESGEVYWGDNDRQISYDQSESSEFKNYWRFAPKFRPLDSNNFVSNYAVYLMAFIFITMICYFAVLIITYTRCITIAINNRQIYDDLKHLGAAGSYLQKTVKNQISKVFFVPALIGSIAIFIFYGSLMFFNDGRFAGSELLGLFGCLLVMLALSLLLYAFYRYTLRKVCRLLKIN